MSVRAPAMPEPYRLLFPLGVLYALLAASVWPMYAARWIPYPATLHWTLMAQGFLQSFVLGFLLTAMPAFLHGEKAKPWETATALAAMITFGICAMAGWMVAAQSAYLVTILLAAQAGIRRFPHRRGDPPEEFALVALGLAFAAAGALMSIGIGAGWWEDPAPRYALHLFTEGMMLSIALGVGGLLVPTFSGMREPLVIPGVARPGERRPRRILYALVAVFLIAAMAVEATGRPVIATRVRLIPVLAMVLLVWKILRFPAVRTRLSATLWSAGWFVFFGLTAAALWPARPLLGFHLLFLGGFGLLILGIATRVVVRHGGHPLEEENRVLGLDSVIAVGLALALRLAAEFAPHAANGLYGVSGLCWIYAWSAWGIRALPRIIRSRFRGLPQPGDIRPQGVQVPRIELPLVRRHM